MGLSWMELRLIFIVALCALSAVILPLLIFSRAKRSIAWLMCWGGLALVGPCAAWACAGDDAAAVPLLADSDFPTLLNGLPEAVRSDLPDCPAVTDTGR